MVFPVSPVQVTPSLEYARAFDPYPPPSHRLLDGSYATVHPAVLKRFVPPTNPVQMVPFVEYAILFPGGTAPVASHIPLPYAAQVPFKKVVLFPNPVQFMAFLEYARPFVPDPAATHRLLDGSYAARHPFEEKIVVPVIPLHVTPFVE